MAISETPQRVGLGRLNLVGVGRSCEAGMKGENMKTIGAPICFGANPEWATLPIHNLPSDTIRVRRKIRFGRIARVFVKTPGEVQEWLLAIDGDGLKLVFRQGMNVIH